mmetsp:Transcript_23035/g.49984  ORF Transcript_23035/g.49984 Transcript_23035/m.49984 type:complete len:857 (+) Transcript_23035:271-2841(+)
MAAAAAASTAASPSSGGGGSSTASPSPPGYSVDVRIFLVVITAAMAISFGVGVAFGPTTAAELAAARTMAAQQQQRSLLAAQEAVAAAGAGGVGGDTANKSLSAGTKMVQQPRRLPTDHAVELGARVRNLNEKHVNYEKPSYEDLGDGTIVQRASAHDSAGGFDDDDEHLPQGQHLLVDIKNVNAEFLNSESRLADAMVSVVESAGLTLLSYHCHSLSPAGVSCVGVLLESHISFHTWPEEGVITLDLFTCGPKPLLPVIPDIEAKFGLPRLKANATATAAANPTKDDYEEVKSQWAHELRGFRHPQGRKNNYLDDQSDLAFWVTGEMDMEVKKQIVSTESPFQRIDIWDILDIDDTPSHQDGIKHNLAPDDPRWLTNEVASPERLLFLDGTLQSMSESEREYHEALVHPAMFAHPHPERVAIVGGGEGATLREVLKHDTVTEAVMIELDEMMVDIAKEHLPFMSDCSDLVGSAPSCFDDERATVLYEDGRAYFFDKYGPSAAEKTEEEKFDVIVLDALDPEDDAEIADKLYTDDAFLTALYRSMSDDGVLIIQVGTAPSIHDPRADLGVYARREKMFKLLEGHSETAAMFVYEEAHCGFLEPHSFLVVCKSDGCRKRWYAESDEIDFAIYERILDTKSSEPALVHFDGSTQRSYQIPPRAWETVYCRREPEPFECAYRGLDLTKEIHEFDWGDEEENSFEVKVTKGPDGKNEPRVYAATDDIKKGDYIMASDLAASFTVSDDSLDNLKKNTELVGTGRVTVIENLLEYVDRHGHRSIAPGSSTNYVEVGGSFMIRRSDNEAEVNIGKWIPTHPSGKIPVYSPVYERRMRSFDVFLVATRDIEEGEEIVKPVNLWA